jgi:EmrB/QacA subfamily drug resistance transporter
MSDRSAVALVFVVAMFMDIMDGTIVNTALPSLGKEFGATSPSSLAWIVLGYLLSLAIWIPASGWLGDKFGTKRVFLFALATFTIASVLCGFAGSVAELSALRFAQGVGGGMLTPVGTAMLFREYPPHERARASAILVVPTLLAPALGPVLGGYLTDGLGWRWIFFVNAPIGLAIFLFGLWRLKEYTHHASSTFDPAGFLLSATALGGILYGLNQAELSGWTSPRVLGSLGVGVVLGSALVVAERRRHDPLLALRLFRDPVFRVTNIISVFSTASFFGLILLMPLMLQGVRGLSAASSGLTTFPQALGVICMSQLVRALYPRIGPRRLLVGGLTIAGIVMLGLLLTTATTTLWVYRGLLFGRGMCWAFVFIPLQAAGFSTIAFADTGRASSLFSTQRQVSSSLGIAVLITLLEAQLHGVTTHHGGASISTLYDAYKVPFFWCAMFAFVAAFASIFLSDDKVLAVLQRREEP